MNDAPLEVTCQIAAPFETPSVAFAKCRAVQKAIRAAVAEQFPTHRVVGMFVGIGVGTNRYQKKRREWEASQ